MTRTQLIYLALTVVASQICYINITIVMSCLEVFIKTDFFMMTKIRGFAKNSTRGVGSNFFKANSWLCAKVFPIYGCL